MNRYNTEEKLWLLWFGTSAGAFLALEGHAIASKNSEATLTYTTRHVLGLDPPRPWRYLGSMAIVTSCIWVAAHLVTGRFVPSILQISEELKEEFHT